MNGSPSSSRERGAGAPRVEVTTDAAGNPTAVRVSFAVAPRFELDADTVGHGLLRDAVRRSFAHRAIDARRLTRARRR